MKKISTKRAVEIAYRNLYNSKVKDIGHNLDNLLKAKKIASQEKEEEMER